jgi:hypothetical protein
MVLYKYQPTQSTRTNTFSIRTSVDWQTLREELIEKLRIMPFCDVWMTPDMNGTLANELGKVLKSSWNSLDSTYEVHSA